MATLREALESAYSSSQTEASSDAEPVVQAETPAPDVEDHPDAPETDDGTEEGGSEKPSGRARDETGRFASAAKAGTTGPVATAAAPGESQPPVPEPLKPPQSWRPEVREKYWAKLDRELQEEMLKRDKETQSGLQESTEARRFKETFQQTINPYQAMIQASGQPPERVVGDLLGQMYLLQNGAPQDKAQFIAQLIHRFGVNEDAIVDAYEAARGGQPGQQRTQGQPQAVNPEQIAHQVRQQLMGEMQQQAHQAQLQQKVGELQRFVATGPEFWNDVQVELRAVFQAAEDSKKSITVDQAYQQACRMNGDVWGVLQGREKAKGQQTAQATIAKAKAAASSVKSRPTGGVSNGSPKGIRGHLEAAWNANQGGE